MSLRFPDFRMILRSSMELSAVVISVGTAVSGCGEVVADARNARNFVAAPPEAGQPFAPLKGYEAMKIPEDNPLSMASAELGRQLFFDRRLSGDASRSCYDCHLNEKGLTDGIPVAIGAFNKKLTRNSPTLWNIGYHAEFYWDGRAKTLEAQALAAWKGGNMGAEKPEEICAKLNQVAAYRGQFQKVFGTEATPDAVAKALACYMRTIVSIDTAYDRQRAGDATAMSAAAQRGQEVFKKAKCDNCHSGHLFTDQQYHNIGIGMSAETPDPGRFKVSNVEKDKGAFKTPTLRDVVDSAPYFHDGSAATLEDAVRTLVQGGIDNPHLDRTNLQPATLGEEEIRDLIEFLKALDEKASLPMPTIPQ